MLMPAGVKTSAPLNTKENTINAEARRLLFPTLPAEASPSAQMTLIR